MERKIKEFERYANIEIPELLMIGIVIRQAARTDEDAPHHELAQVGNIPGHQDRSDERQASSECSGGKIGRRSGRGCLHERIQECFQRFWQITRLRGPVLVLRDVWSSSFRLSQEAEGQRKWKVEKFQEKRQQREEQQERVQRQMLQVWQGWSHVQGLLIQKNECIRSWRRVGRDGMHRNGMHRFECIGDRSSAVARERSQYSCWDRIVCCSDCVPEECCGRLPDAPRQARRRVTDQRQIVTAESS